jgi:hypothetical protein
MPIDYYYIYTWHAADNTIFKGDTSDGTSTTIGGLATGTASYFTVYPQTQHDGYGFSGPSAQSNTVTPTAPDTTGPGAPSVTSTSHPYDQSTGPRWYPGDDIAVSWTATDPSGNSGYSMVLGQDATTTPGTGQASTATSESYQDRPSGKHWFHGRAKDNAGNWGDTVHFPIQIDVTAPAAPTASRAT